MKLLLCEADMQIKLLAVNVFGNWLTGRFRRSSIQSFLLVPNHGDLQGCIDISINATTVGNFTGWSENFRS